jgi:hypothetical protein
LNILNIIGRDTPLFSTDIDRHDSWLRDQIGGSRFLVIGGAGSIGQAVVREIFARDPKALHVVDISENNMVELVREIRSTLGYIEGDFRTFAIDCGAREFSALIAAEGPYDYVLNLSALKHVRSEKDPFTLMRLIEVNVLNTLATVTAAKQMGSAKYFAVSTDKAANPVNLMGASKRIMEMFLMRESLEIPISTARFANVAFSDGSLLHGFNQRFAKRQPISAPNDVRRYFVTPQESGELCLMSCLLGENRDVFFPSLNGPSRTALGDGTSLRAREASVATQGLELQRFSDIATRYLQALGYEPYECASEEEARGRGSELIAQRKWPVYFFTSDTTGEKDFEEFYTDAEVLDLERFTGIGVIKNKPIFEQEKLDYFLKEIARIRAHPTWGKAEMVALFNYMIPGFNHLETGKYLDSRM